MVKWNVVIQDKKIAIGKKIGLIFKKKGKLYVTQGKMKMKKNWKWNWQKVYVLYTMEKSMTLKCLISWVLKWIDFISSSQSRNDTGKWSKMKVLFHDWLWDEVLCMGGD